MNYIEIHDRAGVRRVPAGGYYTLGRATRNDVVLYGATVSRNHARLTVQGDRIVLEDIGSTYGTSINGRPIFGAQTLHDGDQIKMGDARIIYRHIAGSPPNDIPTPAYGWPANLTAARPQRLPAARPPLAANMIQCAHCGTTNLRNNTLCYKCGCALLKMPGALAFPKAAEIAIRSQRGAVSPNSSRPQVHSAPRGLVALLLLTIILVLALMGLLIAMVFV